MTRKNKYIFIGIIIILILSLFYLNKPKQISVIVPFEQNIPQEKVDKNPQILIQEKIESVFVKDSLLNENKKNTSTSLKVFDKSYSIKTEEGVSVYDVMKSAENSGFSFNATESLGLGYFVKEINGVVGSPGKYWIYYVNGEKASVGVSSYIIKEGDIISWKQEGI